MRNHTYRVGALTILLLLGATFSDAQLISKDLGPVPTLAHRSGCHRWGTCPPDMPSSSSTASRPQVGESNNNPTSKPDQEAVQPTPSHKSDSTTSTFNEPDGFMGVPFGSSQDVLHQRLGWKPKDCTLRSGNPLGIDQICTIDVPMGIIATQASFHYRGYPQGTLLYVMLTFDRKDYEAIEEMFITRYGEPGYRNTDGLSWQGCCSSISLGRTAALIGGREYLDGLKRKIHEKKDSIKKGMEILQ